MTLKQYVYLIIGIGYLVFFNSLFNGFVWDDGFQIVNNIPVHKGLLFYYFSHTIGPYYRPLMLLSYTIIYQLFHLNAFFFHFIQISIHIVNVILIFWLLHYFSKNILVSFFLATLFLMHPMNAEPVNYIANLQDIMFTFFGLTALFITLKNKFGSYSFIASSFLLLLSILAKETGILFAAMSLSYSIFIKKSQKLKFIIGACASFIIYLIIRITLVGTIKPTDFNLIPPNTILEATFLQRLLTIPKIIYFYLATFIYPADLAPKYWYVRDITIPDFILPLIFDFFAFSFLIIIGIFISRRVKNSSLSYWFFFFWFCLGLGFHLQILPLDKTISDRWFYFPMIGLLGMTAVALSRIQITSSLGKKGFIVFILFIYTILGVRTMVRNNNWYSDLALFSHDLPSMENIGDIHYNYAIALVSANRIDEAIIHYKRGTQLIPNSFMLWHNLGMAYLKKNNLEKAGISFTKAVSLKMDEGLPNRALVYTLILQYKYDEAIKVAKSALKLLPNDVYLWRLLGLAEYKMGNKTNAQKYFQKSISLRPDPVTKYYINQLEQNLSIEFREL